MKASLPLPIPMAICTDAYKATHQHQYPDATKMVSYGEFRCGYDKDTFDTRVVHFGIRKLVEQYLHRRYRLSAAVPTSGTVHKHASQ